MVTYTQTPITITPSNGIAEQSEMYNGGTRSVSVDNTQTVYPGCIGIKIDNVENLSDACIITAIKITYTFKATATTWASKIRFYGGFGPAPLNGSGGVPEGCWPNVFTEDISKTGTDSSETKTYSASLYLGVKNYPYFGFVTRIRRDDIYSAARNPKGSLSGIKIGYTRTRACHITFKGDGVTETKTTYDYGSTPSYGSTPTREGYTFKGWSNGTTTYTGTLPTAYEQDVTYTAVWEKTTYYLDLNGMLDGVSSGSLSNEDGIPYGTADIYINGSLVSQSVGDYYAAHDSGSTYEIKNIKANDGYRYDGVYSGSLSGTLTAATQVVLSFSTNPTYTITYNINAPTNAYTSGTVEAQTCDNGDSVTIRENNFKVSRQVFFVPNRYEDEDIAAIDTKTSYAPFLGWFTEAAGGTQISGSYTPTGNITLYAHWGDFSLITPVTYINEGYVIEGWYTDASGGTKTLEPTEQYYPTNEYLYVYAHWIVTGIYIGTSILDVYIGNKKWDVYQGTTKIYGEKEDING